jgi:adenine/guanine phosphoribosyltransferase-like PRPP-binding protein
VLTPFLSKKTDGIATNHLLFFTLFFLLRNAMSHLPLSQSLVATEKLQLGSVSMDVPLSDIPGTNLAFLYIKLNDHPALVDEGARLIAERIKASGCQNPFFVTPEASTLALAHVLRSRYHIEGMTLYKARQLNDQAPLSVEYFAVTSPEKKTLFLGRNRIYELMDKDIFILDSICTTGGTLLAMYELLIQSGVASEAIVEASVLFTEGETKTCLPLPNQKNLLLYACSHLPIISK